MRPSNPRLRARLAVVLLLPAVVLLITACVGMQLRQGWRSGLGPVVPHDSFPGDCNLCHEGGSWHTLRRDFEFDHGKVTGLELRGAHAGAQCLLCHNDRGPVAKFAARGCAGCHEDPHRGKLGQNCTDCHGEVTWYPKDAIARHDRTRMPLIGAHAAAACFRCHPGAQVGNFEGADTQCATCHARDLARATSPDHAAQGWTTDCQRCHVPTSWRDAEFAHPASFPLTQGHSGRQCSACHVGNNFGGLSRACDACHSDDYQRTASPPHVAAGFGMSCDQCHNTSRWPSTNYTHTASFPLSNAHAGHRCSACHATGIYQGLPNQCVDCHLSAYQRTSAPNHVTSGFPTACQNCHSTVNWATATFQHTAAFPLTGGHAGRRCAECHASGVYRGLPNQCSDCHLDDYQRTTTPNHQGSRFPTSCQTCHSTTTWRGATFNHRFPINSGDHAGRACTDCHLQVPNYASFSCTHCHEHSQTRMDSEHRGRSGYSWSSPACLNCHPNGRG